MAIRKGNKICQVVLTPFHQKKLELMCSRSGLPRTQVIQRLIENFELFDPEGLLASSSKK